MTADTIQSKAPETSPTGYHGIPEQQYEGRKENWKSIGADFHETTDGRGEVLEIDGHPVMEQWEHPYMAELARVATQNGGVVLEVGFGLGLSGTAIQKFDIEEHIIIEANDGVIARGKEWAKTQPHKVTFMHGLWQDEIKKLKPLSVDGVLYDTYPLTKEEQHTHQFDFIRQIFSVLKPGGVLTYCNLTSIGVLRGEYNWGQLWRRTQVPHLKSIGFDKMSFETVAVTPPDTCKYYSHKEALLPTCRKLKLKPPTFIKLKAVTLRSKGVSLHTKVVSVDNEKCIVGDEGGFMKAMLLSPDQIAFMTSHIGKCVSFRNASVKRDEGLTLFADKWGKIVASDEVIECVGEEDLSAKAVTTRRSKEEEGRDEKKEKEED